MSVQRVLFSNAALTFLLLHSVHSQGADVEWVPASFEVPELMETEHFRLRTLTVNDVVKDYDAVMLGIEHRRGVFGPNSTWTETIFRCNRI